ncbi:MDR family MFS transporter [Aneurinibacillus sp. REN35]|uniref:MDR family MFS transporter n=1 Tax=Aneurinibacillus sp. REN35 TaxID=3237286 RepID=UPI00352801E4
MKPNAILDFHPIVRILFLGSFLTYIGLSMVVPYFAIYLAHYTGLSGPAIGFIIGGSALIGMFGGLAGGVLSDRFGRKNIMLGALLGSAIIFIGLAVSVHPIMLVLFTLLKGMATAFFDPCAKALIADLTEPKKRVRAFSYRYLFTNLGFAVGPIIGMIAGVKAESTLPFFVASVIFLMYFVLLWVYVRKYKIADISSSGIHRPVLKESLGVIQKDKALLLFICGGIMAMSVHGQFSVVLPQYFAAEFTSGLDFIQLLWTVHSLVIIIGSMPVARAVEKRSAFFSIVIGSVLFAIGCVCFSLSFNVWTFIFSMIIFTLGEIFIAPAEYAIIDEITPESVRGTYYGAFSFTTMGSFLGPGFAGMLLVEFGGSVMFSVLTLAALISIFFYWRGSVHKMNGMLTVKQ